MIFNLREVGTEVCEGTTEWRSRVEREVATIQSVSQRPFTMMRLISGMMREAMVGSKKVALTTSWPEIAELDHSCVCYANSSLYVSQIRIRTTEPALTLEFSALCGSPYYTEHCFHCIVDRRHVTVNIRC